MNTKLTLGMIGVAGFGGHRRHLIRQSGRFQIAAVCDRNPDALAKAAAEESAKTYTDFDALLHQPGLDGIVVSTGGDTHAQFAIAALRAGKHVFIEKPLCPSVAEVNELRRVQKETGKAIGMGHNHCPTDGLLKLAREYVTSGKLGVVATYEENSSHSGGLEIKPGDWRGLADRNPGGMLFQCGVHALHGLNWLFSPVTAYCHELRIFGTKGNFYCDTFQRKAWFQERRNGPIEERVPVPVPASEPDHDCGNLIEWYDAIRGGKPNYPALEDGAQAVLPVFAAELASKERREVSVAELSACR